MTEFISEEATTTQPSAKTIVFVHVRFSLISAHAHGSWKGQRLARDMSDHVARILDKDRLETRCDIFFNYSVPLLAAAYAQKEHMDINVLIHTSDLLPEGIKARLRHLQAEYPFIHVRFFAPDDPYDMDVETQAFLVEHYDSLNGPVIVPSLRLDDDDLLSPSYFPILKKYAVDSFVGFTIHTPRGYEALYADGGFVAFSEMDAPKTGIGLAHIAKWCPAQKKFLTTYVLPPGPHGNTDRKAPVILDGSANCIFRTKHRYNDARAVKDGYSFSSIGELEKRFFKTQLDPSDSVMLASFPVLGRTDDRITPR